MDQQQDQALRGTTPAEGSTIDSKGPVSVPGIAVVTRSAKLTKEQWDVIRALYCQGEKATVLAPRYGITPHTINKRASSEKWPSPQRIARAANNPTQAVSDPAAAVCTLWQERGEKAREQVFKGMDSALMRFFSLSPVPTTFAEAALAIKLRDQAINPGGSPEGSKTNVNIAVLTNQEFAPMPMRSANPA